MFESAKVAGDSLDYLFSDVFGSLFAQKRGSSRRYLLFHAPYSVGEYAQKVAHVSYTSKSFATASNFAFYRLGRIQKPPKRIVVRDFDA